MAMMSLTEAKASMLILLDYVGVFQVHTESLGLSYRSPNLLDLKGKGLFWPRFGLFLEENFGTFTLHVNLEDFYFIIGF